jgi:2-hydroxychromene-2-carboxylate isomerase
MSSPVFYYDFSSPYSYLAATRIGALLPGAEWRPIAFGALIGIIGKVPWSLGPGRAAGMREVEERAAARGLPRCAGPTAGRTAPTRCCPCARR